MRRGDPIHQALAITYGRLGREAEAQASLAEALRRNPAWSVERAARGRPYKDPAETERDLAALRKAGLK
ncbi:MAG: hypothetical protein HYU25_04055 [Candidatus Rokubacteria bacterium]|nr:hypothetical protein [Candidatus Rokubacteria bacterium]